MKSYRGKGAILAVLLAVAAIPQTKVYAGSLNANEQELLAYARGTFEYGGHTYKATSAALAMAEAKLCEDGIDVTDSQLSKAYAQVGDYIETAIYNGYLVRTDWGTQPETTEEPSNKPSEEPSNNENDTTSGTTNGSESKPEEEKPSDTQGSTSQENPKEEPTTSKDNTTVVTDGHDKYYTNDDKTTEQNTITKEQYLEGTVSVTNGDEVIFESTLPVKNTGFTIKNSLLTIGVLGGLLMLTIIESVKLLHFAKRNDE